MATAGRAVEMAVPWKERKSTSSFPSLSTAPWESRKRREIPTFPQPGIAPDGKVENQNQVPHFPTRGSQRQLRFVADLEPKTKKGDRPLRDLLLIFQDHLVLETETGLRITQTGEPKNQGCGTRRVHR